jgi:hypothetical protein
MFHFFPENETEFHGMDSIGIDIPNPTYRANETRTRTGTRTPNAPYKDLSGFRIYDVIDDGQPSCRILETWTIFSKVVAVHKPVLVSLTDTGLTTEFSKLQEPLMIIYQHTPDKCRFYPVKYFIEHEDDIEQSAKVELFDWYWQQPYNCYRQILSGTQVPGCSISFSDVAKAKVKEILDAPVLQIQDHIFGKCLKTEIVDIWAYNYMEGSLKDQPLWHLLCTVCDGIDHIGGPMVLNDTIALSIGLPTIDIRLVEEPEPTGAAYEQL